jgi:hypothetical protein
MALFDFMKSISPSINKKDVMQTVALTTQSLKEHTLPAVKAAEGLFKGQKFKSDGAKSIESTIKRAVESKPLFEVIHARLQNALLLLDKIESYSKRVFSEHETNLGFTYAKATCLRLAQAAELSSLYTRRLINYIYWLEAEAIGAEGIAGPKPTEIAWLNDNLNNFITALNALDKKPEVFETQLNQLPDAIVSAQSEAAFAGTLGAAKMDPFNLRALSVRWNPFYLVGMLVSEWQSDRYKSAQEEAKLLEFRLLQIEKLRDKTQDAKLDREIEVLQDRVTGLHAKISKMETSWGLNNG